MYYNDTVAAKATVDHILSYMRSIPSWAYNGGARAADSGNGGKYYAGAGTGKPDRGQMHYRSGLNMIPLIEWYRANPDDFFLLQIAMGAIAGQMTNIDTAGATSMMWHAYPWIMDFDPHSGDYGLGFFGNALESGAYYVEHARLGPLCFLCTAAASATITDNSINSSSTAAMRADGAAGVQSVVITPEDAYHRRIFIEPLALYLVAQAGIIARVQLQLSSKHIAVVFNTTEWGQTPWSQLRLVVKKTSSARPGNTFVVSKDGTPVPHVATDNTTYAFKPVPGGETTVALSW